MTETTPTNSGLVKCLGERFQDAFLAAWGNERIVAYSRLPAEAQANWNRAAVAFTASLSDAPKPSFDTTPGTRPANRKEGES